MRGRQNAVAYHDCALLLKVVLQATLGRNYTEGIAIDDVTLTDGLCDEEIDPQSSPQG